MMHLAQFALSQTLIIKMYVVHDMKDCVIAVFINVAI